MLKLATDKGVELDAFPFIRIEMVETPEMQHTLDELHSKAITAVFTSSNAVRGVCGSRDNFNPQWSVFCLETATRDTVLQYFCEEQVKGIGANAESLAMAIAHTGVKEVVFFCGDKRLDTLPGYLVQYGVKVREIVVYNTVETQQTLSRPYDAVLFFSPSGVQSFFRANSLKENAVLFAIGTTTAQAIKLYSDNEIIISGYSSKTQIVLDAINHFNIKQATVNTLQ